MTAIDVVFVRGKQNGAAVGWGGCVFTLKIAWGVEGLWNVAARGDGVKVHPAGALPGKDNAIASAPEQLVISGHAVKDTARAFGSVPEFATCAGFGVGNTDRPGRRRAAA